MQKRDKKGRYSKVKRWFWGSVFMFILALAVQPILTSVFGNEVEWTSPVIQKVEAKEVTPEIIEKMKKDAIERLRNAETKGHVIKSGEVFYTNDPTNKQREACLRIGGKRPIDCDSFGPLMIKIPTAQAWYKQLYGKEITEMEALVMILDMKTAAPFAIDAIVKIEGAIFAWTGARSEKEFYEYVVPLIREYEN